METLINEVELNQRFLVNLMQEASQINKSLLHGKERLVQVIQSERRTQSIWGLQLAKQTSAISEDALPAESIW